ncbi:Probable aspartokinase; AltName: Full=Aspartate kinase [Serendipita indica DSM 11827]|nr:Probable aspartokinase; AltName: Full=Aspartate kinase [Serendipita indica DSM 11827]
MATPISTPSLGSHRSLSPPNTPGASTPPNIYQNSTDPDTSWVVQKFGGTSVGKFAIKIAEDAVSGYLDTHKIAVVCSARSGSTKALGTTNLLLKAATEALNSRAPSSVPTPGISTPWSAPWGPTPPSFSPPLTPLKRSLSIGRSNMNGSIGFTPASSFNATVDLIRSEHLTAARSLIRDQTLLKHLEAEFERDCEGLRTFLFAAQVIDEISPRSKDSIIGIGERMACKLIAAVLRDRGIDSEFVSLENIVPSWDDIDAKSEAALDQSFYDRLSKVIGERVKQCGTRVPVVTGFFGPVPGSLLRQVGRGYTDLLAALLAVGLDAAELQIWKEVDGIFTADPRKVPTARLIPSITPDEAAELTYYGSEVVHPFTMEQVIRRNIPIRIKNVENAAGGGTLIRPPQESDSPKDLPIVPAVTTISNLSMNGNKQKLPTAVTFKEAIVMINISSNRKSVSHGFLARIFGILDKYGLTVDLISTSEVHVSMAAENRLGKKALDRLISELEKLGTVTVAHDMAILSLVGRQMRNMVGIAGRMFSTLAAGKVNIEMISQGASEINISCVIDGRDAIKALNLIHQSCLQISPEIGSPRLGPWLF